MSKVWSEAEIVKMLSVSDSAVERAILRLYSFQTDMEQATGETKEHNGKGFSGADAKLGTYYAKWIASGKNLSGRHLSKARIMAIKYRSQLTEHANGRLNQS